MDSWYVVMTKPGKQDQASKTVKDGGFNVLNPKLRQYNKKKGRYIISPLFPLYIFVKFNMEKDLRLIKYTRGVSKILGAGPVPVPIDSEIVDNIIRHCNENSVIEARMDYDEVKEGDKVIISDGPLQGMEAVVTGSYNENQRVEILLNIMKISIEKYHLKKIS